MKLNHIYQGNVIDRLKDLDDNSIQCVVTSPPYWGLRDYGVDNQLGLEETPEEFVDNLVKVFKEVKRVLREDGTLWLNLGDTYSAQRWTKKGLDKTPAQPMNKMKDNWRAIAPTKKSGLPDKNLVGIPWRVAFALQSDGWYLRQDIIWHKPNPMPESVTDRCTKSHEYIFLMTKSSNYYYNAKAIAEKSLEYGKDKRSDLGNIRYEGKRTLDESGKNGQDSFVTINETRNKRSVWKINTKPYKEAHFAVFPEELPTLCIKAGSKENDIVLDPFFGSGTTGWVAQRLKRKWIGIELNPEYVKIAEKRFAQQDLFT
jgi:DNA modification methylase